MARYIKLDKIEPLPTDGVLDDITKSLQDWVWEAYKKGIQEQIVANTILIDKHFAKTNRILVDNLNIPPMICGLEIKLTEELPDGYNFALVEAPKTERDRIIKNAKAEVAREIFEKFKTEMRSEIARNEKLFAEDADDFYEGRNDAFRTAINCLAKLTQQHKEQN